ncbi:WG repeat-containing protein [Chitinophagaceae bacterium MMS25-I14]
MTEINPINPKLYQTARLLLFISLLLPGVATFAQDSSKALEPPQDTLLMHHYREIYEEKRAQDTQRIVKDMQYTRNRFRAIRNSRYGIVDSNNKIIVPFRYCVLSGMVQEGLLLAAISCDTYGYIDVDGNVKIPFIYEMAQQFSDGLAPVTLGGKSYYINHRNRKKLTCNFKGCSSFHNGRAVVYNDKGIAGYISRRGRLVIDHYYQEAYNFHRGTTEVRIDNKYYLINRRGRILRYVRDVHLPEPL